MTSGVSCLSRQLRHQPVLEVASFTNCNCTIRRNYERNLYTTAFTLSIPGYFSGHGRVLGSPLALDRSLSVRAPRVGTEPPIYLVGQGELAVAIFR